MAGEERAGRQFRKRNLATSGAGENGGNAEREKGNRVARQMQHRLQKFTSQFFPIANKRPHQLAPGTTVFGLTSRRFPPNPVEDRPEPSSSGCASATGGWIHFRPKLVERQRPEKRRTEGERMDRRTDIVHESGHRQLRRAHPASDRRVRFQDSHGAAGPGERNGGRQAIRTRAHHNCVVFGTAHCSRRSGSFLSAPGNEIGNETFARKAQINPAWRSHETWRVGLTIVLPAA